MEKLVRQFSGAIIKNDEASLRQKCDEVDLNDGFLIAKQLIDVLKKEPNGAGLAAPQIGLLKRVFVIKNQNNKYNIYINPIILKKENPFVFKDEGCLSFPNERIETIRYNNIIAKCENELTVLNLNGFDAVCFVHENDHLDGRLMFDNLIPDAYDECFCGSKNKFKFCCRKLVLGL